ncbi:fumarylacetoacetate hydrolase family protein [Actinomadura rayongensis]|uniref:Fumarylacetoacetase-like C-terminal domain-containing protein n=1 Tax=Actinomadura rayongensis TaxID=1429076 RepID=A0A6I4WLN8_9ACTN|nr:fumarylacetoacetate hydrolase family protein [Actinomadura rayongensis]MXQ67542.1 hypothetical protein [Actinomadura rayongensis]
MRLVGLLNENQTWIGAEQGDEVVLLAPVDDFYADPERWLAADALRGAERRPAAALEFRAPVRRDAKVFCAGLNYRAHAAEADMATPDFPDVFGRWASTLVPSETPVPVPVGEPGLDWEGELAVIVGRELRNASPTEVEDAVIGFTCFNDISARTHQLNASQWTVGKNADASGPIGPVVVTRDEIPDPYALRIRTRLDGETVQDGGTAQMIFNIGQIGAYVSECVTLLPGDVIATGTPEGIGAARKPPVFMRPGQVVEVEIERIGVLRNPIVASNDRARVAAAILAARGEE